MSTKGLNKACSEDGGPQYRNAALRNEDQTDEHGFSLYLSHLQVVPIGAKM